MLLLIKTLLHCETKIYARTRSQRPTGVLHTDLQTFYLERLKRWPCCKPHKRNSVARDLAPQETKHSEHHHNVEFLAD